MLSSGYVLSPANVAALDEEACIACGVCVSLCPEHAIALSASAGRAVVDANSCRGCGICAAECPAGALTLGGFSDAEILAEVTV